ncbi:oligosaccharide flippase family protein [Balneola sp. MJW-20]|uniref:oligosaccharide flippase family protein n=1 Tax=Gracilimonas aurantiaca TaxID=3234185 RepID=UPI0034664AF3
MGIIKQQSIQNSVITYLGILLGFISTLYLYPNILTTDQYGLTRILLSVAFICTEFTHLGVKNIAIKFFPEFENKERKHNGFLFLLLVIPLAGFLLFLAFLFSFDDWLIRKYTSDSPLFGEFYLYLIPLVIGILYFDVINSYIRANYDSVPGSIVNEIMLRFAAIVLLVLMNFGIIDFQIFMAGFAASYLLQPVLLVLYLFRSGDLYLKPNLEFLNSKLIRRISNYGFFVLLGGVSHLIVSNIDILMLGSLSGLTDTAVYTIAFYIGSVIVVPQKSIGKIAPSLISKHISEDNIYEVEKIYKGSSLNQLVAGCLIYIGVWANIDNLIAILPEAYAGAKWVVIIIGASKLIDMAGGVNGNIIMNSPFYKFNLMATSVLIVFSVFLNFLLIPEYGITGAAIATAISLLIYNLVKGIYVWYRYRIQPLSPQLLILFILSAAILFLSMQISTIGGIYIDIMIRSFTISAIYIPLVISLNVSGEVNIIWQNIRKRFF